MRMNLKSRGVRAREAVQLPRVLAPWTQLPREQSKGRLTRAWNWSISDVWRKYMKRMPQFVHAVALLLAALLPLEQARCALMSLRPSPLTAHVEQHATDGDDGCDEPSCPPVSGAPTDPCCCAGSPLPAATAPASVSLPTPDSHWVLLAAPPATELVYEGSNSIVGRAHGPPTSSPPDPAASPRSPRSPPYSA